MLALATIAGGIAGMALVLSLKGPWPQAGRPDAAPAGRTGVGAGQAAPGDAVSGRTVYVPVYSHIYHRGGKAFLLEATLSVRNTDRAGAISLAAVDYYDAGGRLLRRRLERPLRLPPLGTAEFLVEEKDESGGAGASFLVTWSSEADVSDPVIEAVMIGTAGGQGISFLSPGRTVVR